MTISIHCICGRSYRVPEHFAGKRVTCKACGAKFQAQPAGQRSAEAADPFDAVVQSVLAEPSAENKLATAPSATLDDFDELKLAPVEVKRPAIALPPLTEDAHVSPLSPSHELTPAGAVQRRARQPQRGEDLMPGWKLSAIAIAIGASVGVFLWGLIAAAGGEITLGVLAVFVPIFAYVGFMQGVVWRVFEKAGLHGAGSLIPIYNLFALHEVAGLPLWFLLMWLLPVINFFPMVLLYYGLAKNFGQGLIFALGLFFFGFVLFPVLAFGDFEYEGDWKLVENNGSTLG
jgi:hypothetical protein